MKGYIYLLQADRFYKIGKSINVKQRVRQMTLQPFPVEVKHIVPVTNMALSESALHRHFKNKRVNGEWFALATEDVEIICSLGTEEDIFRLVPPERSQPRPVKKARNSTALPRVTEPIEQYLRPQEVARILGVNVSEVYCRIHAGRIPAVRLGGGRAIRVPQSALNCTPGDILVYSPDAPDHV